MSNALNRFINSSDLDPETRYLVREVVNSRCQVTIEENGVPVAVVIPYNMYDAQTTAKTRVMESIRKMQKTANLSPKEADELALEAVETVRSQSS